MADPGLYEFAVHYDHLAESDSDVEMTVPEGVSEADDISVVMTIDGRGQRSSGREIYDLAVAKMTTGGAKPGKDGLICSIEDHSRVVRYNRGVVIGFLALLESEAFDFTDLTKRSNLQAIVRLRLLNLKSIVDRIFQYLLSNDARSRGLMPETNAKLVIHDRLLMMVALADGVRAHLNRNYLKEAAKRPDIAKGLALWVAKMYTNVPNLAGDRSETAVETITKRICDISRYRDFCIIFASLWAKKLGGAIWRLAEEYTLLCQHFTAIPGVKISQLTVVDGLIEDARLRLTEKTIKWNNKITKLNVDEGYVVEPVLAMWEDDDFQTSGTDKHNVDEGSVVEPVLAMWEDDDFQTSGTDKHNVDEGSVVEPVLAMWEDDDFQTSGTDKLNVDKGSVVVEPVLAMDSPVEEDQEAIAAACTLFGPGTPSTPKRKRDWSRPYCNLTPIKKWSPTKKNLRGADVTLEPNGHWQKTIFSKSGEARLTMILPDQSPFVVPEHEPSYA